MPIAKEWQQRPLESIYAVVFLDAIHYYLRSEGKNVKQAVYTRREQAGHIGCLDVFSEHWDKKYPKISQSWWAN